MTYLLKILLNYVFKEKINNRGSKYIEGSKSEAYFYSFKNISSLYTFFFWGGQSNNKMERLYLPRIFPNKDLAIALTGVTH